MRKITRREKMGIALLCVVAAVVWMMNGDEMAVTGSSRQLSVSQAARVLSRFRNVRQLPDVVTAPLEPVPEQMRNIFRFGSATPTSSTPGEGPKAEPKAGAAESVEEATDKPVENVVAGPPPVDFKVEGIIMGQGKKAAVITREPELFVVPVGATFLEQYILKEVSREGLRIGFTGFDETVFLPVEKNRGN